MATIGENLRTLRKKKKMSLNALAIQAKVGVSTITAIERNDRNPKAPTIGKLAHALGVLSYELDFSLKDATKFPEIKDNPQGLFISDSMELTAIDYFRRLNIDEKVKCLNCMRGKKICGDGEKTLGSDRHHENRDTKAS
ncbi:MAG: helix-turn-helix domain-containing protein [Victivallales bacterium]|jgi:transcriptional regulator with XRE-family HTH domain